MSIIKHFVFLCRRGMTLTELLIASIIVSIILVGIVSAGFAIRKMESGFSSDTTLYMNLAAAAERIRYDVANAVGDASNPGIAINLANNYYCFRMPSGTGTADAAIYTGSWRCYSKVGDWLYRCTSAAPGACTAANACTPEVPGCKAHVASDVFSCADCYLPRMGADHYFEFKLVNSRNAGNAQLTAGKLNTGTEANPQVSIEYRVFPEAHSF